MTLQPSTLAILMLPLLAAPALAQDAATTPAAPPAPTAQSSLTLTLSTDSNAEQVVTRYTCEEVEPFSVTYINAEPNFLALVPIEGRTVIFTAVLAGSGVRYASGQYEWWTKGAEATLYNLTDAQGAPARATCSEFSNVP